MSADRYSFKVGSIDCMVLLDGVMPLGAEGLAERYPDATEAEYRQAYADIGLAVEEAHFSFNILLARIGDETILVDAGEGGKPNGGDLLAGLGRAGIEPEAVTQVVTTHVHGDHVLGLLMGDQKAVFPNATYVISKPERAFWESRIEDWAGDQRPIVNMMETKGLRLIEMDEQVLPGLTAVPIPGHTPGHIALLFESGPEKLIHMADLLHTPMQFAHPEWCTAYDGDVHVTTPTRRNMLGRAADENLPALFYHLPFPGLGRINRAEEGFTWEPL